jgi:hypothetical protein
MNTTGSEIAERQFITKEFADTLAGKFPAPYLRLHDRVQKGLAGLAADLRGRSMGETAYLDRMIHFWREVSLAGLPRTDTGQDECYATKRKLVDCGVEFLSASNHLFSSRAARLPDGL